MVGIHRENLLRHNNSLLPQPNEHERNIGISWLQKEQYEVEREIIRLIHSSNVDLLKPNCPNGITIRDHRVYVTLYDQDNPEFQVWQWHGHILMYDQQSGCYMSEYFHGHYYERLIDEIADAIDAEWDKLIAMEGGQDVNQNMPDDSPRD